MSKKHFIAASAAILAFGAHSLASANDEPSHVSYFSLLGSYTFIDSDRVPLGEGDYGIGMRFMYGRQYASRWGWALAYESQVIETDIPSFTDFYRHALDLHLTYALSDREGFTPYLLAGIGGNFNDVRRSPGNEPEDGDGMDVFGTAGLGFVTGPVWREGPVKLRGEARYIHDRFNGGMNDVQVALGIEISLFEPVEVVEVEPEVKVVEVPKDLVDSDGDGIPDKFDQCPDTPRGTRVDAVGCPLDDTLRIYGPLFDFDSARLNANAQRLLEPVVEIFQRYPDLEVEVAGHTDSIGSADYNQRLSERRAAAVRDYLISRGIAADNLQARGYGEEEPIASNDTEDGRQQNRRVEIRILN